MRHRRTRGARLVALLGALALSVAACGGDDNGDEQEPAGAEEEAQQDEEAESGDSADGEEAAADDGLPEPLPAAEGELTEVRLAQSVPALSFAPLDIARYLNFFEYQGISLEFVELESGAAARQALIGGSVDLVDTASTEAIAAVAEDVDYLVVQGTINQTLELCVRQSWLDERGVTPDDPLEDRLAALEGATLGITGPGAVSDRGLRWMLIEYGGLDPDNDTVITQIGSGQTVATALENDQIQGFLLSPPTCQLAGGEGVVLVPPSDVPEFSDYVHEVLFGMRPWVEDNAETVTKVATALSMGNNYIIQQPETALAILQEIWSDVDPDIVAEAFESTILPQVQAVENGLMTEEQWEATNTVLVEAGLVDEPIDVSEGSFWTNDYIDVDAAQVPESLQ